MGALQSIVPLFIYMNKFYIETKLNRDLKDDLIKLFTEHVAEKHIYSLMPLLLEAQSTPFQVTPSTMANIVKGLYTLRPVMNVITIEDYKSTYWPKLDGAIDQLLTQSPGDYIPISYEQIYSCEYKCVGQQHSEQMYSDLIKKITNHLERVSTELQVKN